MKKSVLVFLISCSVLFLLCSSVHSGTSLNLGTDDFPPYEFEKNGEVTGLCTEIVKKVIQRLNMDVNSLKIYPWKRGMFNLEHGIIDALYTAGRDKEREKKFIYPSEELIMTRWVLFIKKKDTNILKFDSLKDLRGKKIGVTLGYNYTPEFWDFLKQEQNYEEVRTNAQNFKKLAASRLDYVVSEYGVGLFILKKLKLNDKITALLNNLIKIEPQYIMFSRKTITEGFVRKFSDELTTFKTTSQYQIIMDKYLK